ncbi:hypothetical protein L218DRAFT_858433 [Marasmius fiardii PR-910]|nr:hypothetical protein L218DRAFT_858433 [Marasmius fiardii PR-910]
MTDTGKPYRVECTGIALETVKVHSSSQDITLFGSCFCPFVQRVWAAFQFLDIPYKNLTDKLVDEVDPYKKPQDLLEVSPKGLVPGLRFENFNPPKALNESTVILEYLNDVAANSNGRSLLPPTSNPYARALIRLQCDHCSRSLVPSFYRYLQAQDTEAQIQGGKEFADSIETLVSLFERTERELYVNQKSGAAGEGERKALRAGLGLWVEGNEDINMTDVMAGPWLFRTTNVLKHYRGFQMPSGTKFSAYLDRLFNHPVFKSTCSTEDLYLDSYERYAFNRPNTSQVANAINSGRSLP